LKKSVRQLSEGEITKDDFGFLLISLPQLGQTNALTELGAAQVAVDKIRKGFIQLLKDADADLVPYRPLAVAEVLGQED
jgi:hypothetical protein